MGKVGVPPNEVRLGSERESAMAVAFFESRAFGIFFGRLKTGAATKLVYIQK
jgi:hypothetical protein